MAIECSGNQFVSFGCFLLEKKKKNTNKTPIKPHSVNCEGKRRIVCSKILRALLSTSENWKNLEFLSYYLSYHGKVKSQNMNKW